MTNRHRGPITVLLGLLAICVQLPAQTKLVLLKDQQVQTPAGPVQEAVAERLRGLGASNIQPYTVLNMLRATVPAPVLPMLEQDPDVAAIVDPEENAGVIDHIDQYLANAPTTGSVSSQPIYHGTEGFARLIDRIATEHDLAIFTSGDLTSLNTIRAGSDSPGLQSALEGVTQNRHIALRALAENAAAGPPAGLQSLRTDSISTSSDNYFRLYKISPGSAFHTTFTWDRHFSAGLEPYRRRLGAFLYDPAGAQLATSATGALASEAASDLVLKIKMLDQASAPAGEETFALAMSRQGLEPVNGPALDLNCSHGESTLDCTVSNTGDLPVFGATAHFHGSEYTLGKIEPGGMQSLSVPTSGADAGDPNLTVRAEAFGEIIRAAAVSAASTPPDPPQLSLSCAYSTQSAVATVITCDITDSGGVPISNIIVTAVSNGGAYQQVTLATLTAGSTGQAVFNYSSAGFVGSIYARGTADQLVTSNYLLYKVANQPPTPGAPGNCTAEGAIADAQPYPPTASSGSVAVKTQTGCHTQVALTANSLAGLFVQDVGGGTGDRTVSLTFDTNIAPDKSTSTITRNLAVSPNVNTLIPVTQAGLTCSFQPSLSPSPAPMAGGLGTVTMAVEPNCQWSSMVNSDFVRFVQGPPPYMIPPPSCCNTGPASVQYLVLPNTTGADRQFTLQVGGKTITGTQLGTAQCSYTATATGSLPIAATGGSAGVGITASPSTCTSSASNDSPGWLTLSGSSNSGNWNAGLTASSNIKLNASSSSRTANVTVTGQSSSSGAPFSQNLSVTQTGLQCTFTPPAKPFSIPATGIPQNQPQTFSVTVSNPGCQWTASSGSPTLVFVVNSGVVQTGSTTYTVQYWAKPKSSTTSAAVYIQAGDQTYDGFYVGGDIDIKNGDQNVGDGDEVPVTWTYTGLGTDDTVKVKIESGSQSSETNTTNATAEKGPNLKLPAKGTKATYTITVTDVTANVTKAKTVTIYFPQINVTAPNSTTPLSRSNGGAVQWNVVPAGADIGATVTIQVLKDKNSSVLTKKAPNPGPYKVGPVASSLQSFNPGPGYTLEVDSNILDSRGKPKWSGKSTFTLSGIRITKPAEDGTVVVNKDGKTPVEFVYQGTPTTVKFTLTDQNGLKGSVVVPTGDRKAYIPTNNFIGADASIGAATIPPAGQDSEVDDSAPITVAGIVIAPVTGTGGDTTVKFNAVGSKALGDTFSLDVKSANQTYHGSKGETLTEGENTATVRVPPGTSATKSYTIIVTTSKGDSYEGNLTVQKP